LIVDSEMTASLNRQPSTADHPLLLRARVVLPVSQPPIREGAVLVSGKRIAAVGCWRDLSAHRRSQTVDLGEAVLMPGLVNGLHRHGGPVPAAKGICGLA
jgi:imidazolonepropionase-like amidohydrolase